MIYYDHLPLDKEILKALGELSINYVFQPVFYPDGKTVYAWEALMRPTDKTVLELINEYMEADNLHVLEVATLFGAMQAYILRGYTEKVSLNSFPNDCLRQDEANTFWEYFGDSIRGRMIVENLEYPSFSYDTWQELVWIFSRDIIWPVPLNRIIKCQEHKRFLRNRYSPPPSIHLIIQLPRPGFPQTAPAYPRPGFPHSPYYAEHPERVQATWAFCRDGLLP
jgi:hypothetical protein